MDRGISEVTAVGDVVSLIARASDGTVIAQLTASVSVSGGWMVDVLSELLARVDPLPDHRTPANTD